MYIEIIVFYNKKSFGKKSGISGRNWNFGLQTAWLSYTISTSYLFNKDQEMVDFYVLSPVSIAVITSTTFKSKLVEIPFPILKVVEKVESVEFWWNLLYYIKIYCLFV